mgnify:CR=1 FL=1
MKQITESSTVTVNYTGKLEDGTIFDSSMKEGREPLTAVLGNNQLIRGFEQGLIGMSEGETKTIEIEASESQSNQNEDSVEAMASDNVDELIRSSSDMSGESHPSKIRLLARDISRSFSNYGY